MAAVIPNGYYIKARKIQNSDISTQPPHVREIWDWLIKEANHKDNGKFHRGQCLRTYRNILDGLCWFVGYRKMSYTKSQCENALKWLTKQGMITKSKTTRGLIITICNYDFYQNPKNYENHTETDTSAAIESQSSDTINKNDKNIKNEKILLFEKFWELYDKKVGKEKTRQKFLTLSMDNIKEIIKHVPLYVNATPDKQYRLNPLSYLNEKRWLDELPPTKLKGVHLDDF